MALKDILVQVDSSRAMPGRVRAAADLARTHEAHLIGIYVIEAPVLPSYAEAQIPARIIDAQRSAFAAAAANNATPLCRDDGLKAWRFFCGSTFYRRND